MKVQKLNLRLIEQSIGYVLLKNNNEFYDDNLHDSEYSGVGVGFFIHSEMKLGCA